MQITTAKPMARGVTHLEYVGDDESPTLVIGGRELAGAAALAYALVGRRHAGVAAVAGIALLWPLLRR